MWTDQKIEAAFHDVLVHGDLSDIEFLQNTLGLTLEVVQWEHSVQYQKQSIETDALATEAPSYMLPYGIDYFLWRNTAENTSRIRITFEFQPCRGLSAWGKDWNTPVRIDDTMDPHGAASFHTEEIRWGQDGEGIAFSVTTGTGCNVQLEQKRQGAMTIPNPPRSSPPGPGTELLEQVIDLVAAGDLRDYLATARILHTDMSTFGKLRGHQLYDGGAVPQHLIPGTNSGHFFYTANDTGWFQVRLFVYEPPRRGPRIADLQIPVDTLTTCIPPEGVAARMRERRIRFGRKIDANRGPYLQTFQRGNAFSIRYDLQGSCIEVFYLQQETDFLHSPR